MTETAATFEFQDTGSMSGNVYMDCGGWGVSYNANPGCGFSMFAGDSGSDETAIVYGGDFYILNGDFRSEYARLAESGGLAACLRFYLDNDSLSSSWSAGNAAEALAKLEAAA